MGKITLEVPAGTTIADAAREAQTVADAIQRAVEFDFNSVVCVAVPGGSAEDLAEMQGKAQRSHIRVNCAQMIIETRDDDR